VTVVTRHNVSVPTDGSGLLLKRSGVKKLYQDKTHQSFKTSGDVRNDANTYCVKAL
jgi:hypothetical protein